MSSNSMWTLTLILLVALFGFVPSINALSVDWKADKHPTHTLDHITAVLSGGSGDPSKVNVVLYTYNQYTGQSYNIPIASNVGNTGSYTVQVPNHYIGDIPSGKTESQYFAQDLRYRTQALNPSNNQPIGQSADFVIFWNPDDGTSTPTKFSTTSSSGSSSSGSSSSSNSNSNSGSQSSSSSSNDNSNKSSGSSSSNNNNNDSAKSPSSDSTNKDTSQGVSSITGTATVVGALADSTSIFTSTAPAVTVSGVLIPGKTATVTSVLPGTTHSISGNASSDKSMTGAIVGAVVGGLVALALLGWLAVWCCRRRRIARRPTAGQALSQPQRLPEAGIITPAIWANRGEDDREERDTTVGTMLEKQVDLEAGRNSPLEDEKVAPSLMLTGDFPILSRRLSGETLSGDDDHVEKGQASPTSSASNHPAPVSSTRTSWLTAGQGSFSEPFTPPPEYSRRQTTRSSTGAIDAVLANIA